MKLSDYISNFLTEQDVRDVFLITGGAVVHLVDSIAGHTNLNYICTQHEQAAAMAADAYSRITENIGVAVTTSGPGATNLVTGVCCSYYDSIPTVFLIGQVPRSQLKGKSKVRQIGFQETDIVSLFKPITKYSTLITAPETIRYELEKAFYLARSGRPGPVLLDIPDDIQRAEINPSELQGFIQNEKPVDRVKLKYCVDECVKLIQNSERPVLILGGGIKLAKAQDKARRLVERLNFPVALTWAAIDMFPQDYPLSLRDFGVSANRPGNFVVQNSDLVLAIGTRLDTHETGNNLSTFARGAKKVVVDIDEAELKKFKARGMKVDILINSDVNDFLEEMLRRDLKTKNVSNWARRVNEWKLKYPICLPEYFEQQNEVNPYVFMDVLSRETKEGDIVITDAGGNLTWTMQGYKVKKNQKLFSAFNHSPMGYSLPASIGAYFASTRPIICIIGDGGIQMNIQELSTIKYHSLPIRIFLFNNHGYGIIQQTQDTWLESRYAAANPETGVAIPDFVNIAKAYGVPTVTITNHRELKSGIRKVLDHANGPILCNVEIEQHQKIMPKLEFGKPIEDASPLLNREEFFENMIMKSLRS